MRIDLNSDLGESYGAWTLGDDTAMLDLVSSANIACGFHAGDPATLRECCRSAVARGVVIGAHSPANGNRRLQGSGLAEQRSDGLFGMDSHSVLLLGG